jgi:hypothetical protein
MHELSMFRSDGELTPAADFGALGDAKLQAVLDQPVATGRAVQGSYAG